MKGEQRSFRAVCSSIASRPAPLILFGAAVIVAILAYPLALGSIYTYSDLGNYHLPLRVFYQQCLRHGLNFTWMPSILCGYYVHAEGQVGMYHPLHYLLYRLLPFEPAFALECVLAYPILFAGMAMFLRRWRLPHSACLFGAFLFTFGGFNLLHSMHINAIQVIAHIPWLLLLIDAAMRGGTPRRRRLAALGVAVLSASQWLMGFPQAVYFSALAEGPYALLIAGWMLAHGTPFTAVAARLAWLLAAKAIGMLASAVQWLPTLDMLMHSERADPSPDFSFSLSAAPRNLLQFIGPYFFRGGLYAGQIANPIAVEFGLYNGVVATVLTLWALARLFSARASNNAENDTGTPTTTPTPPVTILAYAAVALGIFALLMSFGDNTFVYPLVSKLPFLRAFRGPARHVVLVHLAMGILGAFAFADLPNESAQRPRRAISALATLAWLVTGLFACHFGPLWHVYAPSLAAPLRWLISPALITLAVVLAAFASRGYPYALTALALLAVVDQAAYGLHFVWQDTPASVAGYAAQFSPPPTVGSNRVYVPLGNAYALRNIDNSAGYSGVILNKTLTYDTEHLGALRLAGVRWATNIPSMPNRDPHWFELRNVLPRIRFVSRAIQSRSLDLDVQRIDLAQTAFVTHPIQLNEHARGTVLRSTSNPGYFRIETETTGRQILVISESYHEGWRATVDGKQCPLERVNGDFMGCVVESGVHAVELQFAPDSLTAGKWASGIGIAALLGLATPTLFATSARPKKKHLTTMQERH